MALDKIKSMSFLRQCTLYYIIDSQVWIYCYTFQTTIAILISSVTGSKVNADGK